MDFTPREISDFDERLKEGPQAIVFEDFPDAKTAMDFVDYCLSIVYTDGAFIYWWNKPNKTLGDRSPIDLWAESPQDVINAAANLANL